MKSVLSFFAICALILAFGCSQTDQTTIDNGVGVNTPATQQTTGNNLGTIHLTGKPGGGIKVSNTSVACGASNKETNDLTGQTSAEVWVLAQGATTLPTKSYIITCKSGASTKCTRINLSYCGSIDPNYFFGTFKLIGTSPDRCTFTLYDDSACTVTSSADSWRQ